MLKVTIDESGTHGGDAVLCVALCLATPTQWRHFVDEWRPLVAKLRAKGVTHYHAKNPRCRTLNEPLVELMVRRLSIIFAITILESEYKLATPDRYRSFMGGAYALAVQAGMLSIGHWCDANNPQWISYVLESGHRGESHVNQLLSHFANVPDLRAKLRLGSHTWVTKTEHILAPPDFVAHEISGHRGEGDPPSLLQLGDKLQWTHLDREGMRDSAEETEAIFRQHKRQRQSAGRR